MGIAEVACSLSSEVQGDGGAAEAETLLLQLCALSEEDPAAAERELDAVLLDMHATLMHAAALSPAADSAVRRLLVVAAAQCTAREVFTLCMATLDQELSNLDNEGSHALASSPQGPASPSFQLFLLATLLRCLPRIRRRPLHFLAEALHMQLRWATEALDCLPLGSTCTAGAARPVRRPLSDSSSGEAPAARRGAPTAASAAVHLSALAMEAAGWVHQLGDAERQRGSQLLTTFTLQLASIVAQLPQQLAAAEAALPTAQWSDRVPAVAPVPGSRLPLMRAAAGAALELPCMLLRPPLGCPGQADPAALWRLADGVPGQLAGCGLQPGEAPLFSSTQAAQGAALATCAAVLALWPQAAVPPTSCQLHEWWLGVLPRASCTLLDAGALQRSVALTLLPLCALCVAGHGLAGGGAGAIACGPQDARLDASSAEIDALVSALVTLMSHNPVHLLRSCAHDALHALLDAFRPRARLALLRALLQLPSTAASVVALQRLRQEMAAAWSATPQQEEADAAAAGDGNNAGGGEPAACPRLCADALALALGRLQHGPSGWLDERDVLEAADVQGAALSLLRWVLLRQAASARRLLTPGEAQRLLRRDLLPLRAALLQLLGQQHAGGGGSSPLDQQLLHSFLAVQRLHEALERVIDLIPQAPAADGGSSSRESSLLGRVEAG